MFHLSINNKDVAFGINEDIARNKVPNTHGNRPRVYLMQRYEKVWEDIRGLTIFKQKS